MRSTAAPSVPGWWSNAAMTAVLADLALETEAATWTSLRLAQAYESGSGESEAMFRRLATAVAKYWICKRGPHHAYEALECLGGNGYTEDWPLARRYREQPVMAVWEGSGNVIALDVLRGIARTPQSLDAFWVELETTAGASAVLDAHVRRVRRELAEDLRDPVAAQTRARATVEAMALALQSSLMLRHAPAPMAEAFVAARLGEDRGHQYGILPRGTDAAAIVERHFGGH